MGFAPQEGQHQCPTCHRYYPPGSICGWCPDHPAVEDPEVIATREAEAAEQARQDAEQAQQETEAAAQASPASAPTQERPPAQDATPATPPPPPAPVHQTVTAPAAGRTRRER